MKKVWNYKIRFSFFILPWYKTKQKSRLIFRYAIYLQPKYILVLAVLNFTRYFIIVSRHLAHTGPFAINVHWTFIERSVLFGRLPFHTIWIATKIKSMSGLDCYYKIKSNCHFDRGKNEWREILRIRATYKNYSCP